MGCCISSHSDERNDPNDQQPMINIVNISKDPALISSQEKSAPLLTGTDRLAFQNVAELSSGSDIDKNVLDELINSTSSDAVNEEEEA